MILSKSFKCIEVFINYVFGYRRTKLMNILCLVRSQAENESPHYRNWWELVAKNLIDNHFDTTDQSSIIIG